MKALIDSYIVMLFIGHIFCFSKNVLKEYNKMEGRRNKKSWNFCGIYYIRRLKNYHVSCKKNTANENLSVGKTKQIKID